jgi:hypothetical protein
MSTARVAWAALLGVMLAPGSATGQVSFEARAQIARMEHRVQDGGPVLPASGNVFGAALGLLVRDRFEVWAGASGGRLAAASADAEDRDVAEVEVLGRTGVRPWITLDGGVTVRSYTGALARQRWTSLRLGAEARVPLHRDAVRGVVRGHWMPVVSVSGVGRPSVALVAGAGVEWRGSRFDLAALYTLERYDFPARDGVRRLEEVSSLCFRATVRRETRSSNDGSVRRRR